MAVTANPNIIMGFRAPEIQNPMALAAQGEQIRSARNQNAMAEATLAAAPAKAAQELKQTMLGNVKDIVGTSASAEEANAKIRSLGGGADTTEFEFTSPEHFGSVKNTLFPQKGSTLPKYEKILDDKGNTILAEVTPQGLSPTTYRAPEPQESYTPFVSDTGVQLISKGGDIKETPLTKTAPPPSKDSDYAITYDASGNIVKKTPIPGTKAYQKEITDFSKDIGVVDNLSMQTGSIANKADELLASEDLGWAFGKGSIMPAVPGFSPATIRSKVNGFRNLLQTSGMQNIKAASGGVGGITEKEWPKMEALFGSLESAQDEQTARAIIQEIKIAAKQMEANAKNKVNVRWSGSDYLKNYTGGNQQPTQPSQLPPTNAQGWSLHTDASGNRAYVSPTGEVEEVQ